MSCSITPVIKVEVGERHRWERQGGIQMGLRWSRRQCGAGEVLLSQHGACRPWNWGCPPSFPLLLFSPFLLPLPLPVNFVRLSPVSWTTLLFLPARLSLSGITVCVAFLDSSVFSFHPLLTNRQQLAVQRKFSHVFLIKAPHRSPVVTSHARAVVSWQWCWSTIRVSDLLFSQCHYDFITVPTHVISRTTYFNSVT